jgi:DNA-binding CsgD family transcriptional regulator
MQKPLSERELEVLKLVAAGKSNRQIAIELQISVRTVEGHRARAMLKLNLSSIGELIRYAVRANLLQAVLALACGVEFVAEFTAVLG